MLRRVYGALARKRRLTPTGRLSLQAAVFGAAVLAWSLLQPPLGRDAYTAISQGDPAGHCQALLAGEGASFKPRSQRAGRLLYLAARTGNRAVVEWLLRKGVRADHPSPRGFGWTWGEAPWQARRSHGGFSALHVVTDPGVAETLLRFGADPNQGIVRGRTPLMAAAARGDVRMVRLLLDAGAEVNGQGELRRWSPLHAAAEGGSPEVVRLLIERGADVNAGEREGRTPLQVAAKRAGPQMVRILLDAGARPNIARKGGRTPLMWAIFRERPETARMLLEAGADPDATDGRGWTPLMYVARYGSPLAIKTACQLLRHKADPNARNRDGKTAMDIARDYRNTRIYEQLRRTINAPRPAGPRNGN